MGFKYFFMVLVSALQIKEVSDRSAFYASGIFLHSSFISCYQSNLKMTFHLSDWTWCYYRHDFFTTCLYKTDSTVRVWFLLSGGPSSVRFIPWLSYEHFLRGWKSILKKRDFRQKLKQVSMAIASISTPFDVAFCRHSSFCFMIPEDRFVMRKIKV